MIIFFSPALRVVMSIYVGIERLRTGLRTDNNKDIDEHKSIIGYNRQVTIDSAWIYYFYYIEPSKALINHTSGVSSLI